MKQKYHWLTGFLKFLVSEQIISPTLDHIETLDLLGSYPLLTVNAKDWKMIFQAAHECEYRLVGLWTEDLRTTLQITACMEFSGEYFLVRTIVPETDPKIHSITPYYLGANRLERHSHDMFGIEFVDHPDKRRWTRHQAWAENQFPLRKSFSVNTIPNGVTPPDNSYPFLTAQGEGIYEIPVGPVHAGIIEPGHFRFQATGEDVINLEEHLGYVHKGIEKVAEGRDAHSLIRLAGRVSGDSTVAHAWAACKACENAYPIEVPKRALFIRALMAERERIANHLGDIAAICNDVGFSFAYYQFMRLKELWLRLNAEIFGHRFMMDNIVPGGVKQDVTTENRLKIERQLVQIKKELNELYPIIDENGSLLDRLKKTGILSFKTASALGALGYVGRASGCAFDVRHHAPYAPYDQFQIEVPVYTFGDVLARLRVRKQEILMSLDLIANLLSQMPTGNIDAPWKNQGKAAEGIGLIEGWRGEILAYVKLNSLGLVERYFPRDPSWFTWPALEQLIHGNIVPDFPVCNKSVNGTYSGVDL